MNTEKTKKTNKFEKNLSQLIIEFFSKKITRNSIKHANLIEDHKKLIRNKFSFDIYNVNVVLSLLPFILGFSQFLTQKYSLQKENLFFEKNLPGLSLPAYKMEWETFQYLFKNLKNQNTFPSTSLQVFSTPWSKISSFKTSKKVSSKYTDLFLPTSEKNLVGYFQWNNKNFHSNWEKFLLHERHIGHNVDSFYQNLDEIPNKLSSLDTGILLTSPLNFQFPIALQGPNLQSTANNKFAQRLNHHTALISYKSKLAPPSTSKFFSQKNSSSAQHELFLRKYNQLAQFESILFAEIKKIFLSKKVLPINCFNPVLIQQINDNLTNIYIEKILPSDLQSLLVDMDKIQIPNSFENLRLMSGYKYPDMDLNEVRGYLFQKNIKGNSTFKILLPPSYLLPRNLFIQKFDLPKYFIETQSLILQDKLKRQVFYEGPSITLDPETGLDWKLYNVEELRVWLEQYLGLSNPTFLAFKNFFGIFESSENISTEVDRRTLFANYYLENFGIQSNRSFINPEPSFLPFSRSFQLPKISTPEWQTKFLKNLSSDSEELNSVNYKNISLPIFEVRVPTKEPQKNNFNIKTSIDFEFLNPFEPDSVFGKRKTKQNNFAILGQNFSYGNALLLNLTSGQYFKIPSLFGSQKALFFADIWEPLTVNSWLITAQVGFAFLVFKILKALADNYGRELLVYLLDLVALLGFLDDDLKQEIEILMNQKEKGFRIIEKTTKNFSNIAGIQTLLPEIVEIVWFLRNSGREFSLSKTLPRGVLLTGPPGTGKTLLVQAIAGEAEVPVLALSGSSLVEPGESGALKLEILFEEARRLAPCIVFIDEMDTLAEKREQVLQNPMGEDELLESLNSLTNTNNKESSLVKTSKIMNLNESENLIFTQQAMQKEKLRILMQFLVELDGIQSRDGVVVFGATNRPEILDSAILRPGRFDRILNLGLPSPEKRSEILQLYGQNLGILENVSWQYLIERTIGYSAADLAGIMNQSTLHAILQNTCHTVETIEYGIDRITSIGIEKPYKAQNKKFLSAQISFHQAGKILLSNLLEHHPRILVIHLWPRRTNVRALQINTNLQKYVFTFGRRIELEHRVIGCYGGKAAEILFLQETTEINDLSDLGIEDIQFAQALINYMIKNWYFYGKNILIKENCNILTTFNEREYDESNEKFPFFESLLKNHDLSLFEKGEDFGNKNSLNTFSQETEIEAEAQKYFPTASWQYQISNHFELSTRTFSDWYRLYLPQTQQNERNLEWIPPDQFYHGNNLTENLTSSLNWNELFKVEIDYKTHSLILESFNKALLLLDTNREVLDKIACDLLSFQVLRQNDIEEILKNFKISTESSFQKIEVQKFIFDKKNNKLDPNIKKSLFD